MIASSNAQLTNEREEVHVWHEYGQDQENPQSLVQPASRFGVPPVAQAADRTQQSLHHMHKHRAIDTTLNCVKMYVVVWSIPRKVFFACTCHTHTHTHTHMHRETDMPKQAQVHAQCSPSQHTHTHSSKVIGDTAAWQSCCNQ